MRYKRIWFLTLFPISALILLIAKKNQQFAEVYSNVFYKNISGIISRITGWLPFSVMEISLIILPFFIVGYFILTLKKIIQNKNRKIIIWYEAVLNVLCMLSIILFTYTLFCGVNYYRYPFSKYSELNMENSSEEELAALYQSLVTESKELREELKNNGSGVIELSFPTYNDMATASVNAMKNLENQYPVLKRYYAKPKPVTNSKVMSMMGITGVFWPFSVETNVNIDVERYTIPATMCHEMAHESGFMREEDANYIAYLACKNSKSKEVQYSGVTMALVFTGSQLYKENRGKYMEIQQTLGEDIKADLRAESKYWREYKGTAISEVSDRINDTYLKANSQNDGIKSYGRLVDLLLAE